MRRITPADAGKTTPGGDAAFARAGSPPRMRGKPSCVSGVGTISGITPADAGKTADLQGLVDGLTDHPRGCGENPGDVELVSVPDGSPPQVRGKLSPTVGSTLCHWITPAGAGKTLSVLLTPSAFQDHPRRCGENSLNSSSCRSRSGSPPQVRGKPCECTTTSSGSRITPAGAGKTCLTAMQATGIWDHPRRCGENTKKHPLFLRGSGSPPQVRGKRLRKHRLFARKRITPAGAGKTMRLR